jgi:hypothetical protein
MIPRQRSAIARLSASQHYEPVRMKRDNPLPRSWVLRYIRLRLVPDIPFRGESHRREPKGQAKRTTQLEQLRLRLLDGSEYV